LTSFEELLKTFDISTFEEIDFPDLSIYATASSEDNMQQQQFPNNNEVNVNQKSKEERNVRSFARVTIQDRHTGEIFYVMNLPYMTALVFRTAWETAHVDSDREFIIS